MYSGLTVILNRPSRFDSRRLINPDSPAGQYFNKQIGKLGLNRQTIAIESAQGWAAKNKPLMPNTRMILALGEDAHKLLKPDTNVYENRGSPFSYNDIQCISTFAPQDCFDFRDYEGDFHTSNNEDEEKDDKSYGKTHGATARKNYKFWFSRDIHKAIRIMRDGARQYKFDYDLFLSEEEIIQLLQYHKQCNFYLDIEVIPETLDITVFSFIFTNPQTHEPLCRYTIVPLRRYNLLCAYANPERIIKALAVAIRDNTVITHNGHQFDLFVLAYKYRIAWGENNYDTMIGGHRLFPEIEKSLGHMISLYTDLPFHKNEGVFDPRNSTQERELWLYNAKDVMSMYYVHLAQLEYARNINALDSINEANDYISAYLTMTFTGIRRNTQLCDIILSRNHARAMQLQRILNLLVGRELNVRSPKQKIEYFFNKIDNGGLGLKVVSYTDTGNPATDEKTLLKLQIKYNLPSIAVMLELSRILKQSSSLIINHWNPFGECKINN